MLTTTFFNSFFHKNAYNIGCVGVKLIRLSIFIRNPKPIIFWDSMRFFFTADAYVYRMCIFRLCEIKIRIQGHKSLGASHSCWKHFNLIITRTIINSKMYAPKAWKKTIRLHRNARENHANANLHTRHMLMHGFDSMP